MKKSKIKQLIASTLATCMAMSMLISVASAQSSTITFTDCADVEWAQNAITTYVANGSVTGTAYDSATGIGTFSPNEPFTREQLAKVISLAYNLDSENYGFTQTYSDVSYSHWAYEYIEAVADYMPGYSVPGSDKPMFYGGSPATRETIILTVAQVLRTVDISDEEADAILEKFEDEGDISYQARAKVANMVQKNVINGYEIDGKWYIKPQDSVTRAEAITILYRATYGDVTVKNLVYPNPITDDSFILKGETDVGARVWVNDIEATVDDSGYFTSQSIEIDATATQIMVEVRAEKNSSTNTQKVLIPIELGAPTINIVNYSQSTESETSTITGNIKDDNMEGLQLFIGEDTVTLDESGNFSHVVNLSYGDNTITVKAANKLGYESTQDLIIARVSSVPIIQVITTIPAETTKNSITINTKVTGAEKIYFGESAIDLLSDDYINYIWLLENGENTLEIKALNNAGEVATTTLTTNYTDNTQTEQLEEGEIAGFSEWIETLPGDVTTENYDIESKTQYRYKSMETTSSSENSLSGWTLLNTSQSTGIWSDWSTTEAIASSTREVETREAEIGTKTQYAYSRYVHSDTCTTMPDQAVPNIKVCLHYETVTSGWYQTTWYGTIVSDNRYETIRAVSHTTKYQSTGWMDSPYTNAGTGSFDGSTCTYYVSANGSIWFHQRTNQTSITQTEWRYRDSVNTNTFYRFTDWTEWSDVKTEVESNIPTETRTVYRYVEKTI